jgi:hypothetical protein
MSGPFLSRLSALLLLFVVSCSDNHELISELPAEASQARDAYYFDKVRPLLNARCVTCHACYTSPCQLNLADHEGIRRGATQIKLYDGTRLEDIAPTRLGVDAHDYLAWNKKGFFPVAQGGEASTFMALVRQRQINQNAVKEKGKGSNSCPKDSNELVDFLTDHSEKGMPFGLPPLDPKESSIFSHWLSEGYPALSAEGRRRVASIRPEEQEQIKTWEELLNRLDPKSRLVARYLYEHMFLGVIEFSDTPGSFFRMVRSKTRSPERIFDVATRRPYDDAGAFYYRFEKVTATITHKNHLIYTLGPKKRERFNELFYDKKWDIDLKDYPDYDAETAANPFLFYKAIPVESRYQFLLDNALYFVSAFIKGSVCEGETAVNVIEEKFFIFFTDPDSRAKYSLDSFTAHVAKDLATPSKAGFWDNFYLFYKSSQMEFVKERQKLFASVYPLGTSLFDIWDGDGINSQAVLTVFRHDDNSYVRAGALGELPKTAWVMDYTIFERMYYLLAAGFDVFGNVGHQGSTRLYMDNLRVESEDLFLSFLPAEEREPLRKHWYRGVIAETKMQLLNPYGGVPHSSKIKFTSNDKKGELIEKILNDRMTPAVSGIAALKGCCGVKDSAVTRSLSRLSDVTGQFIKFMPDLSLIYVEPKKGRGDVFSMVRHKAHYNVALMLVEENRLVPDEDTMTIQYGVMGSFPNFFIHVKEEDIDAFVTATLKIKDNKGPEFVAWLKKYGISRNRSDFWLYFDSNQKWFDEEMDNRGGILDLSKYEIW